VKNSAKNGYKSVAARTFRCRRKDLNAVDDDVAVLMTLKYLGGSSVQDLGVMFGVEVPGNVIYMVLNSLINEFSRDYKTEFWPKADTPEGRAVYEKRVREAQQNCPGGIDDSLLRGSVGYLDGILFRMSSKPTE